MELRALRRQTTPTRRNGFLLKKQYAVYVTENVSHMYVIEAESAEEAENIYNSYDDDQLKSEDSDGSVGWDRPWEIVEYDE